MRLLAALLALLILVEGSGVARALSGESIECCCGRHDAHRVCKCPSCPVGRKRKDHTSRFAPGCDGHDEPAALVVTAVMTPPPALAPPVAVPSWAPAVKSLSDRIVEAGRPPP